MPLKAIQNQQGEYPWVYPQDDKVPEEDRITFQLQYLSRPAKKRITKLNVKFEDATFQGASEVEYNPLETEEEYIKGAVVGWKNMKGENGADIPFSAGTLLDIPFLEFEVEGKETLTFYVIADLLKHINEVNGLTESSKKK